MLRVLTHDEHSQQWIVYEGDPAYDLVFPNPRVSHWARWRLVRGPGARYQVLLLRVAEAYDIFVRALEMGLDSRLCNRLLLDLDGGHYSLHTEELSCWPLDEVKALRQRITESLDQVYGLLGQLAEDGPVRSALMRRLDLLGWQQREVGRFIDAQGEAIAEAEAARVLASPQTRLL